MIETVVYWPSGWPFACLVLLTAIVLFASKAVYNVFFHPLRHIPGPKLFAMSYLPYVRHHLKGTTVTLLKRLHEEYGEVVRYSPDEVSFISIETAFQDIYGFRTGQHKGSLNMGKDLRWFPESQNGIEPLVTADDATHTRVRRTLAHAFSDKALSTEEVLLRQYGDLLISQMSSTISESPEPVDLCAWYNWTTFDVIAALLFGESFGCLDGKKTTEPVRMVLGNIAATRLHYVARIYKWTTYIPNLMFKNSELKVTFDFFNWIKKQTDKRISKEPEHSDFMTYILENNTVGKSITLDELHINSLVLLAAGTETTATLMSGVSYYLCKNPAVYEKVKTEVRSLWDKYEDIDARGALQHAPYLNAVISEGLRLYAPVAAGFPRKVPAGGETISGYFIPEGVSVSVSHDAAYRSERNFKNPESFVPERWFSDNLEYQGDKKRWVQAFSYGPRNCLGKNLAYILKRAFSWLG